MISGIPCNRCRETVAGQTKIQKTKHKKVQDKLSLRAYVIISNVDLEETFESDIYPSPMT